MNAYDKDKAALDAMDERASDYRKEVELEVGEDVYTVHANSAGPDIDGVLGQPVVESLELNGKLVAVEVLPTAVQDAIYKKLEKVYYER